MPISKSEFPSLEPRLSIPMSKSSSPEPRLLMSRLESPAPESRMPMSYWNPGARVPIFYWNPGTWMPIFYWIPDARMPDVQYLPRWSTDFCKKNHNLPQLYARDICAKFEGSRLAGNLRTDTQTDIHAKIITF